MPSETWTWVFIGRIVALLPEVYFYTFLIFLPVSSLGLVVLLLKRKSSDEEILRRNRSLFESLILGATIVLVVLAVLPSSGYVLLQAFNPSFFKGDRGTGSFILFFVASGGGLFSLLVLGAASRLRKANFWRGDRMIRFVRFVAATALLFHLVAMVGYFA
jgi:hypothetical protein